MGLFRSSNRQVENNVDTTDKLVVKSSGKASKPGRMETRRSSGLSRNGSARSVSCSAKTIRSGTGQRTFRGKGKTVSNGDSSGTQSMTMHQSINQIQAMYQNDNEDELNGSGHQSFVSELDVEAGEMAPIGEGSYEYKDTKLNAGLVGPQHGGNAQGAVAANITDMVASDLTLISGGNQNGSHSRYSTVNSKASLPSLARSLENTNDASHDVFDNMSFTSASIMMDRDRAEKIGRSGTRFVYIILLITGIIFTSGINIFIRWGNNRRMEMEFYSYARETADLAETNADHTFTQLETFATTITSEGMMERERIHKHGHSHGDAHAGENDTDVKASWPNVTIPHFDQRIQDLSMSFGATMLYYVPLIQEKDRESWERYANDVAPWNEPVAIWEKEEDKLPQSNYVHDVHNHNHDHVHGGSDRKRRNAEELEVSSNSSDVFKRIYPCTYEDIDEAREKFVNIEQLAQEILEEHGGFADARGISAPIYQYGGPGHIRTADNGIDLMDLWSHPFFMKEAIGSVEYEAPVISQIIDVEFLRDDNTRNFYSDISDESSDTTSDLTLPSVRSLVLNAVRENFEPGAKTIGFVVGVVPWSSYFRNVLKTSKTLGSPSILANANKDLSDVNGLVVKVVSDCGTIFTFVLNSGDDQREVQLGDWKEKYEKYSHLQYASMFFWKDHVHGKSTHCHFDLYIYPSDEFAAQYRDNSSWYYSMVVAGIFIFTAVLFACYDAFIFRGQRHIVNEATHMVINNARRAARNERELNDFIAHEVRNPLAAAISACSFVSSAITEDQQGRWNDDATKDNEAERLALIPTNEKRKEVLADVNIIDSSLHFINDLLRNMLDMQRAGSNQIYIERKPTDIMNDILKPVEAMMTLRDVPFKVILECNNGLQSHGDDDEDVEQLFVMTDPIRLKQVVLNLARNSTKFVEKGFVRCSANVNPINGFVELRVDDSGPGIPPEKRGQVFGKFQQSLDTLQQGTGIGLSLCKKMMDLMGGCLFIDEDYKSGIDGCPGTRFVIQLKIPPLQFNKMMFEPQVSFIDRTRPSYIPPLSNMEPNEKPSSMTSMGKLTDSAQSSVSSTSKGITEGLSESDSDPRLQEPVAKVTGPSDGVNPATKEVKGQKNSKSSVLSSPTTLPQTSTQQVVLNEPLNSIDAAKYMQSKLQELPKNLSVLFVDDDMVLRKLFSRVLKKINPTWNCKEAASGEAALELLTSNAENNKVKYGKSQEEGDCGFDLIFMDQYMASVQKQLLGTETVRAIRAKGFHKPIICGLSANDVEEAFRRAGSDAFMFKPFPCKKAELEKELKQVIYGSKRRR